jgi:hypothetical protein
MPLARSGDGTTTLEARMCVESGSFVVAVGDGSSPRTPKIGSWSLSQEFRLARTLA